MSSVRIPKYHLITYGCQMNHSDSERIATLLKTVGMTPTEVPEDADLILLNTCSVRQSAEDRVFGQVRNFQKYKERNPNLLIAVTGCMPGRDRDGTIKKKLPIVDLYFPTKDAGQLPRWIGELRPDLVNSDKVEEDYLKLKPDYHSRSQAFVTIQTGCNNFCTFCVVPFARGLEKNRPLKDILEETRELAEHGCVEITLLGQTVNSYRAPDTDSFSKNNPYKHPFAALLWEVNQIPGITRLHYTAPHPMHMHDEVMDAMSLPAHVNYIHLPVQAGDNEVLRRMNRRYKMEDYLDVIARLKQRLPGIAIGTDIIVGFCGETVAQFEKTVELYRQVDFDISYTAQYSVRSGTAAARAFGDDVPKIEKQRRWHVLQDLMEEIVLRKNQAYVDQTVSVLVSRHQPPVLTNEVLLLPKSVQERYLSRPGTCFGNSREMKLVSFPGSADLVGTVVPVKIETAEMWILQGENIAK